MGQVSSTLSRGLIVLAAGLGVCLGLVIFAPAQWADLALAKATNGAVRIASPQGSFWDGRGQLQLIPDALVPGSAELSQRAPLVLMDSFQWRLSRPDGIQMFKHGGSLALYLRSESLQGEIRRQPVVIANLIPGLFGGVSDITVPPGQLAVPELDFRQATGLMGFYRPRFRSTLSWSGLSRQQMGQPLVNGAEMKIQLTDFSSGISPIRPLGSYQLSVIADSQRSWRILTTADSVLNIEGSGSWSDRLQGKVIFRCTRSCEFVEGLMASVGKKNGDRYETELGQ